MGRFRADLFHRINVVRLDVPPLRERREDQDALAAEILRRKAAEHDLPAPEIDAAARAVLAAHSWPGNVRELENVLERSLLLARDGVSRAADLAIEASPAAPGEFAWDGSPLEAIEREVILAALRRHFGNRTHAAAALGVSVRTIRNKLRAYRAQGFTVEEPAR